MHRDEMERLTSGTENKSEKIRILFEAGVERAEIARFLLIKYQHVQNVLKRSGLIGRPGTAGPSQSEVFKVVVGRGGRIAIPQAYLERQKVAEGDTLICREDEGNLVIMSRAAAVEALCDIARRRMPEEASLLEALIGPPELIT